MSNKIKLGIVGLGRIGMHMANREISNFPELYEIVAVCDVNPAALERAKNDFNLSDDCLFTDYKKLIDSGLCEMVDICTPNAYHCEQAKYALNAGLPVSIEKPVGINSKVAARLSGADFDGDTVIIIPVNNKVKMN